MALTIGPNPFAFVEGFRTAREDARTERASKLDALLQEKKIAEIDRQDRVRESLSNAGTFAAARGLTPGTPEYLDSLSSSLNRGGFGERGLELATKARESRNVAERLGFLRSQNTRATTTAAQTAETFGRQTSENERTDRYRTALTSSLQEAQEIYSDPAQVQNYVAQSLSDQGFAEESQEILAQGLKNAVRLQAIKINAAGKAGQAGGDDTGAFVDETLQPVDPLNPLADPATGDQTSLAPIDGVGPNASNVFALNAAPPPAAGPAAPYQGVSHFVTNTPSPVAQPVQAPIQTAAVAPQAGQRTRFESLLGDELDKLNNPFGLPPVSGLG